MAKSLTITTLLLLCIFVSCSKNDTVKPALTLCGNVTAIDGTLYSSLNYNNKCWFAQNLNVSKYRNGDVIPQVQDATQWTNLTSGAWCYVNNDSSQGPVYGKLYNWYAVHDSRGLAPVGWHVPSQDEWLALKSFLGENLAGGKMKETGFSHWLEPNTEATNSSGFTALPAGLRSYNGDVFTVGRDASFWTSTRESSSGSYHFRLSYNGAYLQQETAGPPVGMSVRCVKD